MVMREDLVWLLCTHCPVWIGLNEKCSNTSKPFRVSYAQDGGTYYSALVTTLSNLGGLPGHSQPLYMEILLS